MWTFYLSAALLSVIQIQDVMTTDCNIESVTSPSASTLQVRWSSDVAGAYYILELRVVNSTTISTVTVMEPAQSTQRVVHGLRPGHTYQVKLKVLVYYNITCTRVVTAKTVPATSQITLLKSLTSTSIKLEWSSVSGADSYSLHVEELYGSQKFNRTFTALAGRIDDLTPSTYYGCYVLSSNSAGRGARGMTKTVITLVQPPSVVSLESTGKSSARVSWSAVSKVMMYQVKVSDEDNPSNRPVVRNTSSTTVDIGDLEPCSNYTVGVSSFSLFLMPGEPREVSHSTSPIKPVSSISTDYSCSSAMVTVTWTAVFGANSYRATAVDGTGASLNCTSTSTSCHITMLKCGEMYRVFVWAVSDDCESISNTSSLLETVPCAPVQTRASHTCSSNVIVFSWQPTNNTSFYVATSQDNTGKVIECRTVDSHCMFTNADCGQFYRYQVHAVSTECNSQVSQPEFVRTSPCLPTNVRTAAECQSDVLITTWDSAAGALSYTVEVQGNNRDTYNCSSSSSSCVISGVPCGEHLSVWIVASNDNCSTSRVLGEVAETVPCTPSFFSASGSCSQDSAMVTWLVSRGAFFYIAIAEDESGRSHSCRSAGTDCLLEGLSCGQNYSASVISTNLKCNSSTSDRVDFMTAPCPPSNIEAFRDCDANHALIVWQNHQSTGVYTATIEDQSGARLNCTSDTVNNCKILSLPCGGRYNVTVSHSVGNCPSVSAPVSLDSVPCGPEDVSAVVSCLSGELNVTWTGRVPAENYTTLVSGGTGQQLSCNSTDTRCSLGALRCGSSYTVAVQAVTGSCYSTPSPEVTVQTPPCPPTNVTATKACSPNPVPVSWSASDGGKYYTVVAVSGGGYRDNCTTESTSCSLSELQCGETYTIGVSASGDNCTSQLSQTVSLSTEPCVPTDVVSLAHCETATADVTWTGSPTATGYTVGSDGGALTCSSSSTNCTLVELVCDQTYQISVWASHDTCVTASSAPFWLDAVPCAPSNLSLDAACPVNNVTASWTASSQPLNYTVTAQAAGVSLVSCSTAGSSCTLSGLQCGLTYTAMVVGSSATCTGLYSSAEMFSTGPCQPASLTAHSDCGTDSLLASWYAAAGATSYVATVTDGGSFSETCSPSSTSSSLACSVANLQCATQYTVEVTASSASCYSPPSLTSLTTGPCEPTSVISVLHCGSDSASVSWAAAATATGATSYTVEAVAGGSGHWASCQSTATSCQLTQLQCGEVYHLTVVAEDDGCSSAAATGAVLTTAPCAPSLHNSSLICGTASSLLSWTPTTDATAYVVNATASDGHEASCDSTNASCTLADLQCGETYAVTVTARGSPCDSAPGTSANIATGPCPPVNLSKLYACDANTATVTWDESAGSHGYRAELAGDGYQDSCQTAGTSCVFGHLPCGLEFNVTVHAEGPHCSSGPSACQSLQTVPCPPTQVSASQVCSNRSALVTWVGSPGAAGYNVTATGQDGHTHECHTTATSCEVPDIHCGETYNVTVTPYSQSCTGNSSDAHSFRAGLCAPSGVTVAAACNDNTVSWTRVAGADGYVATATAADGHGHTCSTNSSNSCNFTDLHCGETYAVTVVTVDGGCSSEPSSPEALKTARCPPANLTTAVDCDANTVTLAWTPVAGASYVLEAELLGGAPSGSSQYFTGDTFHTASDLLCGRRYAFWVAAQDGDCLSSNSPPTEVSTAPCQPTSLTARMDCGTNRGNFSWAESSGAEFYTVEVTGEHGHVASCSSNDTSCAVKLHCGRSYSATLVASTQSCNSTKHTDIHFDSAPCLPEDVTAELDCDSNVMNVSWTQGPGSDDYTAWAISADHHRASCNTTSNSCSIHGLRCGKVYEVAVTSSSIHCQIIAGSDYKVQSTPCKPENVTVDQNCSSSAMTVKWSRGGTAQNYTVQAWSASGANATCESTESSCSFLNLSCGQRYRFTVTGHTNVCVSDSSSPAEKHTAPCPPSDVSAELNCTTGEALVSWSTVAAAVGYSVLATSTDGHNSSCSDMGTSCSLRDLLCGREYSVVVEAMDTGCPGPASGPVTLLTEPCASVNVSVRYNLTAGEVRWSAAGGATSYSVWAVTDRGPAVSCDTSSTSCLLSGLRCGNIYNVTVTSRNQACDGDTSETSQLKTEPCPPTNVAAVTACEQLAATVIWQQSRLAVGYVAYVENGHRLSCNATQGESSCVVWGLTCGQTYSAWVKARGETYDSWNSSAVPLTSEPCPPGAIAAVLDCEAGAVTVSWQSSAGAWSYVAELTASSGQTAGCAATVRTDCQPSSPQCGETYNVSVKAVGESCNSTARMEGHLATEPCPPSNLSVHYNVSTARVTWGSTRGARSYWVQAVTAQGLTAACNTSGTGCLLSGVRCGNIYNVTVTAGNEACHNAVTSDPAVLVTEPCPPTNVHASPGCESPTSSVSWEQSELAVGYVAYWENEGGHRTSCRSSEGGSTSCDASDLQCGSAYSVWVKAVGEEYNSSRSAAVYVTSAPCLPSGVEVEVSCASDGAAVVSWTSAGDSANVSLTADVGGSLETLCWTRLSSCNVSGLSCGGNFNASLTATNQQCSVTSPAPVTLTTRPCPPQRVAASLQCGTATAVLSWEEQPEVELYEARAVKASGGEVKMCNSTSSTCEFDQLDCGETYNLTVTARMGGCWSRDSDTVGIQTEPCQPVMLSARALCQSEDVQISWQPAGGVLDYVVTARGSLGYVEILNTTQSRLSAPLPCGQDYNVTVQGRGGECDSAPSRPAFFKTTPCVPWDVAPYIQCEADTGAVSWGPSDGAESYVAVATGLDGHALHCFNTTTSCSWSNLQCGEEYKVEVTAKDGNCSSPPSNTSVIHMAPCVPHSLSADVSCEEGVVSLSWDASSGPRLYVVSAAGGDAPVSLTTNVSAAHFSDLACGRSYNLTVTPDNQHCPGGDHSASTTAQTWPCPPAGLNTTQNCLSGIVMVTWEPANGTEYYTATMQTDAGVSTSCMSETSRCSVPNLPCGRNFSVSVTATNRQCNVTSNQSSRLQSVPCVPADVSVATDCANHTALVSWTASPGADRYAVTAVSSHGNDSCVTSDLGCSLENLACGNSYGVQVVAVDDDCSSTPSQTVTFDSAPCQPQGVQGRLDYVTNSAWIQWDAGAGVDRYVVSAVGGDGNTANCTTSTNTTCEVEDLACGVLYNFSVTAENSECESRPSAAIDLQTAPCSLAAITATPQCHNASILVTWELMEGGEGGAVYTATAEASDHVTFLTCNATGTSCYLQGAQCGLRYSVMVAASSDSWSSMRSRPSRVSMEPCPPTNVTVHASCEDGDALVSWTPSPVAESYQVVAVATDGHAHTCSSSWANCSFSGLHCDRRYAVSVTASHQNCSSRASQNTTLYTGPCRPSGLSVTFSCPNRSAVLTWTPSNNAADYYGWALAEDGDRRHCRSTSASCTIDGLNCGAVYNFSVTASDGTCNGSSSQPLQSSAAPCPPDSVAVRPLPTRGEVQVLSFTWSQVSCNRTEYLLRLTGSLLGDSQALFDVASYWTHTTTFEMPLPCGSAYDATVESRSAGGQSGKSEALSGTTAPCPPSAVTYSGNSSAAIVSWDASPLAATYTVYDNGVTPRVQLCNTTQLSCSLSSIAATDLVVTASNAGGESEDANVTHVVALGRRRRDLSKQTSGGVLAPEITAKRVMPTVVLVEWSPVQTASSYTLAVRDQGRPAEDQQLTVLGESFIVTDLHPNRNYCFSVRADLTAASGPESELVCVQAGDQLSQQI